MSMWGSLSPQPPGPPQHSPLCNVASPSGLISSPARLRSGSRRRRLPGHISQAQEWTGTHGGKGSRDKAQLTREPLLCSPWSITHRPARCRHRILELLHLEKTLGVLQSTLRRG